MTDVLHVDIETYSPTDLKAVGVSQYARDPETEITIVAWALNDEPVQVWDSARNYHYDLHTNDFSEVIQDPDVIKMAWNAVFERTLFKHVFDLYIPPAQWRDPMIIAHTLGLPAALGKVGEIIKLPQDMQKQKDGYRLIQKFAKPRKPTKTKPWSRNTYDTDPEDWDKFVEYCRHDVIAEREIWNRLKPFDLPAHEWDLYALDQKINDTGYPIDRPLVRHAIKIDRIEKDRLLDKAKQLTGVDNPNSGSQLLAWLNSYDYDPDNLRAETIRDELKTRDPESLVARVLRLRQDFSKTSVAKYKKIDQSCNDDDRLRHTLQFAGAGRTWRWAGRVAQFHNLPRPKFSDTEPCTELLRVGDTDTLDLLYDNLTDVLTSCIRSTVRAPEGKFLAVCDLNAIENRVLGWAAECDAILEVFRQGKDPYKDFSTHLTGKDYDDVTKKERNEAKPPVLGCGFMLSGPGLKNYADSMGIPLTDLEAERAKIIFREAFSEVVDFWYALDRAMRYTINTRRSASVGRFEFDYLAPCLRIRLPSGRYLNYVSPRIEWHPAPWGDMKETIVYMGLDTYTRKYQPIKTHPGKITENIVQAVARDVLAHGLKNADRAGFEIVGHVHDEIITLTDEGTPETLVRLRECMIDPVPWAMDLPLDADGYISTLYKKD